LLVVAGAVLVTVLSAWVHSYSLQHGSSVESARTLAVVAAATACASATALLIRLRTTGGWWILAAMLGLTLAQALVPPLAERLSLEPLPRNTGLLVLASGLLAGPLRSCWPGTPGA